MIRNLIRDCGKETTTVSELGSPRVPFPLSLKGQSVVANRKLVFQTSKQEPDWDEITIVTTEDEYPTLSSSLQPKRVRPKGKPIEN